MFWYLALGMAISLIVIDGLAGETPAAGKIMAGGVISMLCIVPLGMHFIGTRHSEEELASLLDFISSHVETGD
ncbi:hypothetical protein ACWGM0_04660 [Sphingomonas bisphenolicum]